MPEFTAQGYHVDDYDNAWERVCENKAVNEECEALSEWTYRKALHQRGVDLKAEWAAFCDHLRANPDYSLFQFGVWLNDRHNGAGMDAAYKASNAATDLLHRKTNELLAESGQPRGLNSER